MDMLNCSGLLYFLVSLIECDKTPTPGLRTAPMETKKSMAPLQNQNLRDSRQVGALALSHEGDRREIRHRRGLLLHVPEVATIFKHNYIINYNNIHDSTKTFVNGNRI